MQLSRVGLAFVTAAAGWLGCQLAYAAEVEQVYPGYRWQEVGNGIFVHGADDPLAGPVDGNSVVIINDSDVVVVDTHINPAAARAVIGKIRDLTDKPVSTIVNTHWHDDHTNGNHAYREAFPEAKIVAHRATLAALRKEWPAMEEQRKTAYAALEPDQLIAAADKLDDEAKAISYRVYAGYIAALKPELPTMELVYPDTVFEQELVLSTGKRRIVAEWLGRGNTEGDIVVWLPDDSVLITGDLLVSPIPFAFDSPMVAWTETLGSLQAKQAKTIIPGHGDIMRDDAYLARVSALLKTTVAAVRKAQQYEVPYENLADAVDLSTFENDFTGGDAEKTFAWNAYFVSPGLKSAWVSLGFDVPEPESP
ncbi:MAG: MBL fold metallo-hydrolase [Pseudomonadota bacterium]